MLTALLLLMNSLCQMLDTSCASGILLKNYSIYMIKADQEVASSEGGRDRRKEAGLLGLEQKGGETEGGLGQKH